MLERRWVIVAFGDMSEFMEWTLRASNSPEVQAAFIDALYNKLQTFVLKTRSDVFKYLGDGYMALKELPDEGHKCVEVLTFLREAYELTTEINTMIESPEFSPPPNKFRVRTVAGHVFSINVVDPYHKGETIREHIGPAIDLAKRLLEVKPDTPCICHGSVIKILPSVTPMIIERIENVEERPRNVSPADLKGLSGFRF